jgi:hypothetical protein
MHDPILLSLLIPIVAILTGVGIAALALILNFTRRRHMLELYHKERMTALDKGIELPPLPEEFFSDAGRSPSPHGTFLKGLIFTLAGLGAYIALNQYQPDSALWALIPIGLGLAFLIYYFTVGRKEAAAITARRQARIAEEQAAGTAA